MDKDNKPYELEHLFANNRKWVMQMNKESPRFFQNLAGEQRPEYMWIGCSDSRVPANQIIGLRPGQTFVHRNVGNVVVNSDLNLLSALQYAVEFLKIKHVMIVGHFECGGVKAALHDSKVGLAANWLRHIQFVRDEHEEFLNRIEPQKRELALSELNVIEQLVHLAKTTVVQDAWEKQQDLTLHGWAYSVISGKMKNIGIVLNAQTSIREQRYLAILKVKQNYSK